MRAEASAIALHDARSMRCQVSGFRNLCTERPAGRPLTQAVVQNLARGPGAVLLCGRYEGIDQRLLDRHVTLELSLGDFVLSNGDLAALVLLDAVARLQPGVLSAPSHEQDSFSDGLLEGPSYSRPEVWQLPDVDLPVPAVLLSGHHADVARWEARAVAGPHRAAAAGPDRRGARRRAAVGRRREDAEAAWSIIKGFSILCRAPKFFNPRGYDHLEKTLDLIQTLEQEEIARLGKTIPTFAPGDTVIVSVNVVEGTRKRLQAYEGVVIAKRNRGLNSSFIVRKISSGEGVERTFQLYSPLIASIEVKRRGDVRRAKLYYLRQRSGKSARIKEKLA